MIFVSGDDDLLFGGNESTLLFEVAFYQAASPPGYFQLKIS